MVRNLFLLAHSLPESATSDALVGVLTHLKYKSSNLNITGGTNIHHYYQPSGRTEQKAV
jgi:hypothetical protein